MSHALTPEQTAIVEADLSGPTVVDAGAGTGKTFTLVRRATALVASGKLLPGQILIVTFMKKAAVEVGDRLTVAFSELGVHDVPVCTTFHALAAALVREFAYETGASPDFRTVEDARARAVFASAYDDLIEGRLGVDLEDFPVLERGAVLQRSLAGAALALKNRAIAVDDFERAALAAAETMTTLPFGALFTRGERGRRTALEPRVDRTPEERLCEGTSEAANVRVVAALFRRFERGLVDESLLTYGDLLSRATRMLDAHPSIVARLRARWRHAMVDEFQDTNPQQLAFLRAIFGEALEPVMVVGDVRQSIFAWNGADPRGMLEIAERPGVRRLALSHNRRSPQQILDAAHHVLPGDPATNGDPLTAFDGAAPGIAIRHACFDEDASTQENREREAEAIAREIAALVSRDVKTRDIAVLLRSRTQARVYARALARLGIASKTHGGVGFFDAPEIRDTVAWLRLLDDPGDAFALVRVLECPVVGLSHGTIVRLFAGSKTPVEPALVEPLPAWLTALEHDRLRRLRDIVTRLGAVLTLSAPEAVRATVAETGIDIAHAVRDAATAPQMRANVAKLIALAQGFVLQRPLAHLSDFLRELEERDALDDDETEAELGGDEVPIMTIHGAKGLEWDYVFLANVAPMVFPSRGGGPADRVVRIDAADGSLGMRYDCDGRKPLRWILQGKSYDPSTGERIEAPRDDSEERRLLYVALTRAKRGLFVSGCLQAGREPSEFLQQLRAFCDARATGETFGSAAATPASAAPRPPVPAVAPATARIVERLGRPLSLVDVPPRTLSYTAIATHATCPRLSRYRYTLRMPDLRDDAANVRADADEDAASDRGFKLDAARYGNIVHRALELVARARIDGTETTNAAAVSLALEEHDVEDEATRTRASGAVARSLEAMRALVPLEAEAPFDTVIASIPVGGYVDLIVRDAAGAVTIVDYKTGHLPDHAYALQLALYTIALEARYPGAGAAILRVGDDRADLVRVPLPDRATVLASVRAAASTVDDRPRTGPQCRSCPYAGSLCPEGAAFLRDDPL